MVRRRRGGSVRARVVVATVLVVTRTAIGAMAFAAADPTGPVVVPPAAPPSTAPVPPGDPVPADPVLAAAGDIACPTTTPGFNATYGSGDVCQMRATSDLLLGIHPDAVATLGDNQYDDASLAQFDASFDPTWGRLKPEIHPAIGNHEIDTDPTASGYYDYFGAAAGDPTKGWYSYDLGTWHVIVLNGNCAAIGGCDHGSPEEQWLAADLAAHPTACTLAYWHQPRWSSGEHGNEPAYDTFWQDLYDAGVDVVLNGHDHDYERFAPQDPAGQLDAARGIREFVSGTGGAHFETLAIRQPNSEVLSQTFGVLALTLHPGGYDWNFVPELGQTFTDSGRDTCH